MSAEGKGRMAPRTDADFEQAVIELLAATEALHAAVVDEGEVDLLFTAFDRREESFLRLQSLAGEEASPSVAASACLSRVRALDAEMLAAGVTIGGGIRDERVDLARRRSAIQAHSSRDRGEPRLVTVKA